jgi:excisionase family DNA binding protein
MLYLTGANLQSTSQEECPKYITTSFVAEHCGVSKVTVLEWIEEGRLSAFRLPKGHYRIYRDDFMNFLEAHNIPFHPKQKK